MVPDVEHGLVVVAAGAEALVAVGPVLHQDLRATQEMLLGLLYYIRYVHEEIDLGCVTADLGALWLNFVHLYLSLPFC